MIHFYTGSGKGKTTAAVGQAVRGAGSGMQVIFAQFMKGSVSSEFNILSKIENMQIYRSDRDFGRYESMSEEDKEQLKQIHNRILDLLLEAAQAQNCQMMILDEITYPIHWKLLDEDKLRQLLKYGAEVELIFTGRDPVDFIVESADYITNMGIVSHPAQRGAGARKGIEY